jgi:hypothetical protein
MERQLAPEAATHFACPASQFQFPVQDKTGSDRMDLRLPEHSGRRTFSLLGNLEMSLLRHRLCPEHARGLNRTASSINLQTTASHRA